MSPFVVLAALAATAQIQTHAPTEAPDRPAVPQVDWAAEGCAAIEARAQVVPLTGPARNVVLMIADGMDINTITAARILAGQRAGGPGEDHVLTIDTLPHTAFIKTYNVNAQVPDSAGTATAILSGEKTRIGVVNVDASVERGDCEGARGHRLRTLADIAAARGMATGVVTTTRLTHATPASLYASSPDRDWETDVDVPSNAACKDIARQLVDRAESLNLEVALGGGARGFLPRDAGGRRADGRDLLAAWEAQGGVVARDRDALAAADDGPLLGLFADSHLDYDADRTDQPSLAEMARLAIERLSTEEDGFFLLIEGGRVDHGHHAGNAARALTDMVAFDEAIRAVLDSVSTDETLVLVTSDHGHTLAIQGYPARGNPVLGIVRSDEEKPHDPVRAADGQPYTTLAYANGPGAAWMRRAENGRPLVTDEEAQDTDYRQQSAIPAGSETHGGQDVPAFAIGPGAWVLGGVLEQNALHFVIVHALDARRDPAGSR